MQILEDVADDLAKQALAAYGRTGDEGILDRIGEVLGSSSQTLMEAYLTAVRIRRAEARARTMLADFEATVADVEAGEGEARN
ncbi:MAG: hypothetical protein ACRBBK_06665 [Paracoccaceae bacterium]